MQSKENSLAYSSEPDSRPLMDVLVGACFREDGADVEDSDGNSVSVCRNTIVGAEAGAVVG